MTFDSSKKAIDLGKYNIIDSSGEQFISIWRPFGVLFAARNKDRADGEGGLTEAMVLVAEDEANLVEVMRCNLEREAFI